jgi:hypothetical protein
VLESAIFVYQRGNNMLPLNILITFTDEDNNNYEYQFGTNLKKNGSCKQIELTEEQIINLKETTQQVLKDLF